MSKTLRKNYLMKNRDSIFNKMGKGIGKIQNWFKHRWYPLNNDEIEMINQIFEGYEEVNINDIITVEDENYFIINSKFNFNCILSTNNLWAWSIDVNYLEKNKKTAIINCSSMQGFLMGHGSITIFNKEGSKWINKGTLYWIS